MRVAKCSGLRGFSGAPARGAARHSRATDSGKTWQAATDDPSSTHSPAPAGRDRQTSRAFAAQLVAGPTNMASRFSGKPHAPGATAPTRTSRGANGRPMRRRFPRKTPCFPRAETPPHLVVQALDRLRGIDPEIPREGLALQELRHGHHVHAAGTPQLIEREHLSQVHFLAGA